MHFEGICSLKVELNYPFKLQAHSHSHMVYCDNFKATYYFKVKYKRQQLQYYM